MFYNTFWKGISAKTPKPTQKNLVNGNYMKQKDCITAENKRNKLS